MSCDHQWYADGEGGWECLRCGIDRDQSRRTTPSVDDLVAQLAQPAEAPAPPAPRPKPQRIDTRANGKRKGWSNRGSRAEQNGNSRVTAAQVREIRELHADGLSVYRIAERYPLGKSAIHKIVSGQTWRSVL